MPFFAEIDLGTEDLTRLVDKNTAYDHFAEGTALVWPVLYWLQSPTRERHYHDRLAQHRFRTPIATATLAHTTASGLTPADAIWRLHRPAHTALAADDEAQGQRLTLIDLAATVSGRPVPTTERPPE